MGIPRISNLEERTDRNEVENDKKFESLHKEINDMESTVTKNIIDHFKPKIREIENKAKDDLKKMLEEQLNLREEVADEGDEREPQEEEAQTTKGEPQKPKKKKKKKKS